jgi:hypothetical protein
MTDMACASVCLIDEDGTRGIIPALACFGRIWRICRSDDKSQGSAVAIVQADCAIAAPDVAGVVIAPHLYQLVATRD